MDTPIYCEKENSCIFALRQRVDSLEREKSNWEHQAASNDVELDCFISTCLELTKTKEERDNFKKIASKNIALYTDSAVLINQQNKKIEELKGENAQLLERIKKMYHSSNNIKELITRIKELEEAIISNLNKTGL